MPSSRALPSERRSFLPPLVLGLLPFVLFLPIALVRRVFSAHDVQAYFFPYHVLPARLLSQGELPLWNANVFSGMPLLGDGQTAMFYPPNWLFFLLPAPAALNYVVLLQFSIAGIATYLFARALGLWRLPAFVAAIAYMFCGFLSARVVHLSLMSGAALIPLIFYGLERLLGAPATSAAPIAPATRPTLETAAISAASPIAATSATSATSTSAASTSATSTSTAIATSPVPASPASPASPATPAPTAPRITAAAAPQTARRRTMRWLALTALAVAAQAVAGHPQIPVYTALAVALFAIVRGVEQAVAQRSWRALARAPLLLAGAYLLGYAIAAVQLLPWAELAQFSVRAAGAGFSFVFNTSTTGAEWLLLLFPYLLGAHPASPFASGPWDIRAAVRTWEHSGYVGLLPLALALVALWHLAELTLNRRAGDAGAADTHTGANRAPDTDADIGANSNYSANADANAHTSADVRRHEPARLSHRWYSLLFLALLLGTGLLLAAGSHTPFSQVVYRTPVLGSLRAVERGLVLACFALTVLAGFGLQRIVERPQRRPWLLLPAAALLIVPAFVAWQAQQPGAPLLIGIDAGDLTKLALDRPNTYVPLLIAIAGGLLLAWWSWRPGGRLTQGVAAMLVLVDLGLFATAFNPTANRRLYEYQPEAVDVLRADKGLFRKATLLMDTNDVGDRSAQEALAMSWGMVHGIEDINGFNSLQPRRYTDYLFGSHETDVSYGYLRDLSLLRADRAMLSALNVRYLLVPTSVRIEPDAHFRPMFENGSVRVFENTLAYPRAYFVERVRTEPDPRVVLRQVTAAGFDGRRDALVESATPPPLPSSESTTPATAQAVRRSFTDLRVSTNTTEPRLLVVSEMYFPGWRAYVDDVETPIFRTNYLFRGVVVPGGRHVVRFVYRPASVATGAAVSFLALLGVALLLVRSRPPRASIVRPA